MANEAWAKEVAGRWRLETASGVAVYPTRAAVEAMDGLGVDMAPAALPLADAARAYDRQDWTALSQALARVNAAIASRLPLVRVGEPETWDAYRRRVRGGRPAWATSLGRDDYADRALATWIGKSVGTALGDPVEGWTSERISATHGTITGYLAPPKTENDDTAYPILVLHALDEHGPGFTSTDLALEWVGHLPLAFTAEWAAIDNVKAGVFPPESRWPRNPCGAWIGAAMRAEIHGLLSPLNPEGAGEWAFRDALISHYREGVEGAVFVAALTSLAPAAPSIDALVDAALRYIPDEGRLAATIRRTIDLCRRSREPAAVLAEMREDLDRDHWIHTVPNVACSLIGLLLGEGEFERSILATLACGYDTDCSTGLTGAVLGCLLGTSGIPEAWSRPLGGELTTYVEGFERIGFRRLGEWTASWGERLSPASFARRPKRGTVA